MILITFDPSSSLEGAAWPDNDVPHLIDRLRSQARASQRDVHTTVANEFVILAIRHAIATDQLDCKDVRFVFCGQILQCDHRGVIFDAPREFCSASERLLQEMVRAQAKKNLVNEVDKT